MKNIRQITTILLVTAVVCGTFAMAQTAKTAGTEDWQTRAKRATKDTFAKYVYYYKPGDEQKTKLEKVLMAQYKDLMDFDKTRGPKIKVIDDEIAVVNKKMAELKKELDTLVKRKSVYAKARSELLIDHKAEIENVFTQEQRLTRLVQYIRSNAAHHYWSGIPKDLQTKLNEQFEAAAMTVLQADPTESDKVLSAEYRRMREEVKKVITPEMRKEGEIQYLMNSTMRKFYRIKLTEAQRTQVRGLCEKGAKRKADLYAQYRQLDKDRDAVRRAMGEFSSSAHYYKIREEVIKNVLTEKQRTDGGFNKKTSKRSRR